MNTPFLALADNRLANLCDSTILSKVYAQLPTDVACNREKILLAAAVLTRIYGKVSVTDLATLVRTQPLLIEGMAQLTQSGQNDALGGLYTHADYYEGQVFVRQDYLVATIDYLASNGINLPTPRESPEIEINFWGEVGIWVSPVRLSLDDTYIVV